MKRAALLALWSRQPGKLGCPCKPKNTHLLLLYNKREIFFFVKLQLRAESPVSSQPRARQTKCADTLGKICPHGTPYQGQKCLVNERSTFALYRAHSPSPSFPKAPLLKSLAIGLCTRDPFGVYPFQMHKSSSIVRKYISIYWCPVNFWGRNRSVGPISHQPRATPWID